MGEGSPLAGAFAHHREDAPFGPHRAVRHERPVRAPACRLHEIPVANEDRDRRVNLRERVPPWRMAERERPHLGFGEHGRAFLDGGDRSRDRFEDAHLGFAGERRRGAGVCLRRGGRVGSRAGAEVGKRGRAPSVADDVCGKVGRLCAHPRRAPARLGVERPGRARRGRGPREPELVRTLAPLRDQRREPDVDLSPSRVQRRHLGKLGRVGEPVRLEPGEDLPPPAGERVEQRPVVARNLEPRNPPHERRRDSVAERLKPLGEGVPVVRADELLAPPQLRGLKTPPLPVGIARHVREHRVRVQLRVLVAARQVPESGRDHALGANARAAPRRRLVAPGLQQLRFDPVEGLAHRLVVRPYHPALAEHERFERDRLRSRERDVEPRAVLVLAVAHPTEPKTSVRDVPREHLLEALRAHVPAKAKDRRRSSMPEARSSVLGVVLRVVPVALEVMHRRLGGTEFGDTRDHRVGLR